MYKTALQIPQSTSTARLEQLGVYNTAEELIEAHQLNQLSRLSAIPTGRQIMNRLGIKALIITDARAPLPREIHALLRAHPLPRNMHPVHNQKRREQRARTLADKYPIRPETLLVTGITKHMQ